MGKIFYFGIIALLLISCRQDKNEGVADVAPEAEFSVKKLARETTINSKAKAILNNWPEYNAFETSFAAVYKVENEEDLALVIEDLVEKQKLLADSTYPEDFDKPQIKSRQVVLKTYILKVKGNLEYRLDPQESVSQMVVAYNAYRNQFNVMVNTALDIKSILDEEEE